jgi:hypothetical protein
MNSNLIYQIMSMDIQHFSQENPQASKVYQRHSVFVLQLIGKIYKIVLLVYPKIFNLIIV